MSYHNIILIFYASETYCFFPKNFFLKLWIYPFYFFQKTLQSSNSCLKYISNSISCFEVGVKAYSLLLRYPGMMWVEIGTVFITTQITLPALLRIRSLNIHPLWYLDVVYIVLISHSAVYNFVIDLRLIHHSHK